jgi:hypothetical protein
VLLEKLQLRQLTNLALGITLFIPFDAFAQYLSGTAKEQFIRANVASCMREKLKSEDAKVIPDSLFERAYCRCYVNALVDRVPAIELLSPSSPTDTPVTRASAQLCYQSMKEEAIRLYREGRYPKE